MSHLYRVLGLAKGADSIELKSAYRKLAKLHHPDLHGGDKDAERRFKEICSAYETLSDPDSRAAYDAVCAEARARARRQLRSAVATMSATFAVTVSSGMLLVGWLAAV
jgi:DnaJ-class molecular chaperone